MSPSTQRIVVAVLFVVVGLPPGLCSLFFTSAAIESFHASSADARAYAMLIIVPWLTGLVVFGVMLWLLIWAWRRAVP